MILPPLYPIVDAETLARRGLRLREYAAALRGAGVSLLQYRDKLGSDEEVLANAEAIGSVFEGSGATLIMNDRLDAALLAMWDGVHVGQSDLEPDEVRIILGDGRVIGLSTHTDEQVWEAEQSSADYVAIGPVFPTGSKADAEAVVGLDGVRRARALTAKPLVAIGGITRANARRVVEAGADSVAVISGLIVPGVPVEKVARDFLELLR
jgi:thiamine-phosphate pyrophosphorylase